MSLWHRFVHKMNWHHGDVVSWTSPEKKIMIGFQCSTCGMVTGRLDATGMVDRDVSQALRVAERKGLL